MLVIAGEVHLTEDVREIELRVLEMPVPRIHDCVDLGADRVVRHLCVVAELEQPPDQFVVLFELHVRGQVIADDHIAAIQRGADRGSHVANVVRGSARATQELFAATRHADVLLENLARRLREFVERHRVVLAAAGFDCAAKFVARALVVILAESLRNGDANHESQGRRNAERHRRRRHARRSYGSDRESRCEADSSLERRLRSQRLEVGVVPPLLERYGAL